MSPNPRFGLFGSFLCLFLLVSEPRAFAQDQPAGESFLRGKSLFQDVVTYCDIGDHRTATPEDARTAEWLLNELKKSGMATETIPFTVPQFFVEEVKVVIDDDVAVFYQMHLNRGLYIGQQILSEKAIAAMRTPQENAVNTNYGPESQWGPDYGLGFYLARRNQAGVPQTIHHGGALGSMAWADDDHQVVGVFLSTTGLGKARPIIGAVQQKVREIVSADGNSKKVSENTASPSPPIATPASKQATAKQPAVARKAKGDTPPSPVGNQAASFKKMAGIDEKVSLAELKDFYLVQSPRKFFKDNPEAIDRLFDRLDVDKDGQLTLEEFKKIARSR